MPNLAKIYSDHTRIVRQEDKKFDSLGNELSVELPDNKDAARKQVTHQWLQSTPTQEMMRGLQSKIDELLDYSVALASDNKQDNTKQIISNLKEVNTLRKVINDYGQPNT